ncbi:PREDICTED: speedy protein E4-like [Ceratotherium simum simum]|uniref:Speedy protein E4-like n=1 Tax=Ceratotherium simum simum TaxID=73337 RepID=A0ABM0I5T1_CERSS|nr:PREDICTED: speedy protein E4-like [Ceratotherium simum simum]
MTSRPPSPQPEHQSPQPSTSGYPLEVIVSEEIPGPSAPRVDSSPLPQSSGLKRVWSAAFQDETDEETDEERGPDAEDVWVVESLCGLKMRLKRQRVSTVLPEHHDAFTRLLEDPVIKKFLAWDRDLLLSDKYLLAMVIAYFSRAGLFSWQYQRIHFFIALYLANDMEEDNQAPKQAIFSFLYGENRAKRPLFHKLRFQFIRSMGWRMRVSREECEEIQAFDPELWVWGRDRTLLP